jgi:hypothetical protein
MGAQTSLYCVYEEANKLINGGYYAYCRVGKPSEQANSPAFMADTVRLADSLLNINTVDFL